MEASSQSRTEEESVSMKILPIETMTSASSDLKPSLTWMSWFSRMIIVVSPVSVDKGWTSARFKFFSRATLLHLVCVFGPMLLLVLVSSFNGNLTQILIKSFVGTFETYTWVDSLSMFFMILLLPVCSCVIPMLMATGIPIIPSLALAEDLCWPKHGICGLLGALLFMSANTLGKNTLT